MTEPAPAVAAPVEPTPAPAEPKASAKSEDVEEIVVTGSRIRRKETGSAAPVTVLSKEQLTKSGRTSVGNVLQTLPAQSNAINTQVNNGGDGSTRVDLRGLGTNRTLVLLNGRRFVAGGNGADSSVDLNSIPMAAIESIEVLKDGASAIYGSDAVGGVVNIITKKNWSGTEVTLQGSTSQQGDGSALNFNFTTGQKTSKGFFLFSGGYTKEEAVSAKNRHYSKIIREYDFENPDKLAPDDPKLLTDSGSYTVPGGVIIDYEETPGNAAWTELTNREDTTGVYTLDSKTGKWRDLDDSANAENGGDLYNYQPENYLVTPQQRIHLFGVGQVKLSDLTKAYFELSFTNRQSDQKLAPEPLMTDDMEIVVSADNYYNPFGRDFVGVRRRMVEFGNRRYKQEANTFRIVGGVNGNMPDYLGPFSGWFWDASLNYGRTMTVVQKEGNLIRNRTALALGPSFRDETGVHCGTVANPIDGCVPLDLFHGPGTITPEMVEYLRFTGEAKGVNDMAMLSVNTTGDLFKLFSRKSVSLLVGYDLRRESGSSQPDPLTAVGDVSGNKEAPTSGAFTVNEGYLELSIPIVSGVTGVEDLELSAALRGFHYNTFGGGLTYKLGLMWTPIKDLKIRGTYSTAFRAPNIGELYSGQYDSFPDASDPCSERKPDSLADQRCDAAGVPDDYVDGDTQQRTRIGGNPDLKPETATTFTVGAVVQPRVLKGFSFTMDYYRIDVKQAITTIGTDIILNSCYLADAPQYCDLVQRDPSSGKIVNIIDTMTNVGGDATAGMDFGARYDFGTPIGRFGINADLNWLHYFNREFAGGTVIEAKDTYDLTAVYPSVKAIAGVRWGYKGVGAGFSGRFVSAFKECENNSCADVKDEETQQMVPARSRTVSAYAAFDAFLNYDLKTDYGTTSFLFGVNNVFDQSPPAIYNDGFNNSDPGTYDFMGRYFYLRIGHAL